VGRQRQRPELRPDQVQALRHALLNVAATTVANSSGSPKIPLSSRPASASRYRAPSSAIASRGLGDLAPVRSPHEEGDRLVRPTRPSPTRQGLSRARSGRVEHATASSADRGESGLRPRMMPGRRVRGHSRRRLELALLAALAAEKGRHALQGQRADPCRAAAHHPRHYGCRRIRVGPDGIEEDGDMMLDRGTEPR
jgi:hypothetical protein